MRKNIYIAGHLGMVGSAITRTFDKTAVNVITASRSQLDLCDQGAVQEFFNRHCIDEVYLAAAKVGGIHANNTYPADFIRENLIIQSNVIHSAHTMGVQKLLFLGSSCIYPKHANQPLKEEYLLTGSLEPTNEAYAIAKIAGIKMCSSYNKQYSRDYRCVMPTNLYGPGDNFHSENSHVVPALIRRVKQIIDDGECELVVWGTGLPKREFLHVDDMADACRFVMNISSIEYAALTRNTDGFVNVGTGEDCTIQELVEIVCDVAGFKGDIVYDSSKPDGTPRKLLDVSCLHSYGWKHTSSLREGIKDTWEWYCQHREIKNDKIGIRV